MKYITFFLSVIVSLTAVGYSQTGDDILEKSDKAFFPEMAKFKLRMKIYENNKYSQHYDLECYIKGSRKYLALFKDPPIVRRTAHLRVDDNIWVYLAKINRTKQISAKASFSESAFSEEDILSTSLGYYYNLEKVEKTELNEKQVLKLSLKSPTKKTAYYRIESFIDEKTLLPIKRLYYSFSDQKIKELDIIKIIKEGNKLKYLHLIMYDALRKGCYTEVEMSNFEYTLTLSDKMFTKKYMEMSCE